MSGKKDEDPKLGTCYHGENCRDEMTAIGKVSKNKCKEFGGKSWMSQVTEECEEI